MNIEGQPLATPTLEDEMTEADRLNDEDLISNIAGIERGFQKGTHSPEIDERYLSLVEEAKRRGIDLEAAIPA